MPVTEPILPSIRDQHRGVRFALIGLLIGFLGLGMAAYRMSIESEASPPPQKNEIPEDLGSKWKKFTDKFRHKKPAPTPPPSSPTAPPEPTAPAWPVSRQLGVAATLCGFLAVVLGCASWLAGEHRRWTWAALAVGITTLAWTQVVVAVSIAIAVAIFILILGNLA